MAHDHLEEEVQTAPPRRAAGGGGRLVVAGVVCACALGVGFGLWARPSAIERGDAAPPPKPEVEAELANRKLQIVLDDGPAPIGPLLEVMPADAGAPSVEAPAPELMAPKGPPAGLMKVDAVTAPVAAIPAVIPAVAPPKPEPEAPKPAPARSDKPKDEKAKLEKKAQPKVAKSDTAKKPAGTKAASAEKPEPKRAKAAASKKDRDAKSAKAAVKAKKVEKAEPKKLAKLVKSVKAAPKTLKAKAAVSERKAKREIELVEAKRAEKAKKAKAEKLAKAERAKAEKAKAQKLADARARKAAAAKPKPQVEKASAPKKKVAPRGEGPMRVARNDTKPAVCALADPGEALVCADPRLNQRDRQLQRAFRNAEAAGVPASSLQRQQERWRQARAAAARDGSWAVEDVYEARIAELNDLARDARDY